MRSCHYPGKVETEVEIKAKLNLSHQMTSPAKQRDQDKEGERVINPIGDSATTSDEMHVPMKRHVRYHVDELRPITAVPGAQLWYVTQL